MSRARLFRLIFFPVCFFGFQGSSFAAALTLSEAFNLALKRSEDLAIHGEEIRQAEARFYNSLNYFLPDVRYKITRFEQDVPRDGSGGEGISADSRRRTKPEQKFVVSQPLFSGFKEFAALRASGADQKEQRFEYERARELLFLDVAQAFYTVLEIRADSELLEKVRSLLGGRLKELEKRVRLGRSRESEMKVTETDLKLLESDLVLRRREEVIAVHLLEFYIGEEIGGRSLVDESARNEVAEKEGLATLVSRRSDVLAAEQGYALAENRVVSARGGLFPEVSLDANYYTQRVGFQNGNDWDILLTVDVPIFDAAQTIANIKDAGSLRETARLKLQRTKRFSKLEAGDAYENFVSSEERETVLREASRAARENYDILVNEYRLNLVNNLEVLDALKRFQDIQRRYNESYFEMRKNYWKLKVALGEVD